MSIRRCNLTRNELWIDNKRYRQRKRNILDTSSIVDNWFINNILVWHTVNITLDILYRTTNLIDVLRLILLLIMPLLIKFFLMLIIVMLLILSCSFLINVFMIFISTHVLIIVMMLLINFIICVLVLIWFINHLQYRVESLWNLTRNRPLFNNLILCILIYYHFRLIKSNPFLTLFFHIKLSFLIKMYLNETGSDY